MYKKIKLSAAGFSKCTISLSGLYSSALSTPPPHPHRCVTFCQIHCFAENTVNSGVVNNADVLKLILKLIYLLIAGIKKNLKSSIDIAKTCRLFSLFTTQPQANRAKKGHAHANAN